MLQIYLIDFRCARQPDSRDRESSEHAGCACVFWDQCFRGIRFVISPGLFRSVMVKVLSCPWFWYMTPRDSMDLPFQDDSKVSNTESKQQFRPPADLNFSLQIQNCSDITAAEIMDASTHYTQVLAARYMYTVSHERVCETRCLADTRGCTLHILVFVC
jgi:hypothetical protein